MAFHLKGLYLWNPRQALVVDDFVAKLKTSELYEVDEKNLKRSVQNETEWAAWVCDPVDSEEPDQTFPRRTQGVDK